jgi:membrane protease YdiL (CAAX protease family)
MTTKHLIFIIVIAAPYIFAVFIRLLFKLSRGQISLFYNLHTVAFFAVLLIMYFLHPGLYNHISTTNFGKGFFLDDTIVNALIAVFFVPIFQESYNLLMNKKNQLTSEKPDFPVRLLPNTNNELLLCILFNAEMVIYEELFFRQFFFQSMYAAVKMNPDYIVVLSALFFSLIHIKSSKKEYVKFFISGLFLGKVFIITESFWLIVVMHLALNSTFLVTLTRNGFFRRNTETCKLDKSK